MEIHSLIAEDGDPCTDISKDGNAFTDTNMAAIGQDLRPVGGGDLLKDYPPRH